MAERFGYSSMLYMAMSPNSLSAFRAICPYDSRGNLTLSEVSYLLPKARELPFLRIKKEEY
jgi:hypothetical protein